MVRIKEITLDWFLGHLETVVELLKLPGVDVNAVDHNGNTPLHVAADKGIIFFIFLLFHPKNKCRPLKEISELFLPKND